MNLLILCIKIFFARILDVSLGTIKTFYMVKEKKFITSLISFIETLIWFIIVKEALKTNINSIFIPISYALGFSTGTYLGMFISNIIIKGTLTINIISNKITKKQIKQIKEKGFGVTIINHNKHQTHLLVEIDKRRLEELKKCINNLDNNAFLIINDSKIVQNGYFI